MCGTSGPGKPASRIPRPASPASRRRLARPRRAGVPASFPLPHVRWSSARESPAPRTRSSPRTRCPGNPASEWDVAGAGDPSIQGFATDISVDRGETISFKVDTHATDYRLDIYRLGYYGGLGARLVATVQPSASLPQTQPACLSDPSTGLVDCGNWDVSASWRVPATATSGIYIAKLVREDPEDGRASHIPFVVRDDGGGSDLLFQTSDTTWQAYNTYGGNSLYTGSPAGRAYKVSYNRPFTTRCCNFPNGATRAGCSTPSIRWCAGSSATATTSATRRASTPIGAAPSCWSTASSCRSATTSTGPATSARTSKRRAPRACNLAFFSGNEVFWKTRWETSIDGSGHRLPHAGLLQGDARQRQDRSAAGRVDGHVARSALQPAGRRRPPGERAHRDDLHGERAPGRRDAGARGGRARCASGATPASRRWPTGEVAALPTGVLGSEWDEDLDNGSRPPGLVRLSTTTVADVQLLQDYGSTYASGPATHHLTLYRHASGALVFGAGTIQWAWGLDDQHDDLPGTPTDARMQQATVNLFADMGVQPATLQAGLVAASASTDTTPPTRRHHRAAGRRDRRERHRGDDQRDGERRRRAGRRRRGVDRRRRHLASGRRARDVDLRWVPGPHRPDGAPCPRGGRQRQPRRCLARGRWWSSAREPVPAPDCPMARRPRHRRRTIRTPSRWE